MSKLTAAERKKIPSSKFGEPETRKYPIQDKNHAGNAKARAKQQFDSGMLSSSELHKIQAKANKVLEKK